MEWRTARQRMKLMVMHRCSALIILAGLSTGCGPMLVSSAPRMVTLGNVTTITEAAALQLAETECAKHNRHAVVIPDNRDDGRQSYECKD